MPLKSRTTMILRKIPSTWPQMNWFIKLAGMQPENRRGLEQLADEFVAMDTWRITGLTRKPSPEELEMTRKAVLRHMTEFLDNCHTQIGPFKVTTQYLRYVYRDGSIEAYWSDDIVGLEGKEGPQCAPLMNLFNVLFKEHLKYIVRCDHCSSIYLKFRKNAGYCSRRCQAAAYMRTVRAKAKHNRAKADRIAGQRRTYGKAERS